VPEVLPIGFWIINTNIDPVEKKKEIVFLILL
jgi:hypothetical protein